MKTIILLSLLSTVGVFDPLLYNNGISQSAMQDTLPVPREVPQLLFYIQRDPNANTVCYIPNVNKDGKLNSRNPIKMFWIKYAEKGERKELTYVQKKFAYGIKVHRQAKDEYELTPIVFPQRLLYLRKDIGGNYRIYTSINSKTCTLQRVFIRITGGTILSPEVAYIELTGTELESGKVLAERIKVS